MPLSINYRKCLDASDIKRNVKLNYDRYTSQSLAIAATMGIIKHAGTSKTPGVSGHVLLT